MTETITETVIGDDKVKTIPESEMLPSFDLEDPLRTGKDEMNLVEHPFAVLSWGNRRGSEISITWEQKHPRTGRVVHSAWNVTGHPSLGLPGPTDERLYLVLMELTRECGMQQVVSFSRGNLLDRMGLSHSQNNYT